MRLTDSPLYRVFLSAVSGGAGSFLAALAPLITTPIMLAYLGDYRYGLWMMLMSVTALIGLSDFGITNGITTELSHVDAEPAARRRLISNAYVILTLISIALLAVLATVFLICRVGAAAGSDLALPMMMIAVLTPTILSVPLGFVLRLLYIDLRGFEASIAPGLAAILSVGIAIVGSKAGLSPYMLVFLFLVTVPFTYVLLTVRYFRRHGKLRPRWQEWEPALAKRILRSGQFFVLLSLLVILCNKLDYMIVARVVGVIDLVPYSIADRIIGIANAAVTVLGASLWPVFAQKTREGDIAWIKASIIKINLVTIALYVVFTIVLILFYNQLLTLWLGKSRDTSPFVLIFLSLTSMTIALTSPYFAVANSLGALKEQMFAYLMLLFVGLPVKFFAGTALGTVGVAAGAFGGWALVMLPLIVFFAWRRLNGLLSKAAV